MSRQIHRLTESIVRNAKPQEVIVPVADAAVDVVTKFEKDKARSSLLRGERDRRSAVMRNIRKLAAAADELEATRDGKPVTIRQRTRMLADGGGLWLQVSAGDGGTIRKSWIFRYSLPEKVISKGGRQRQRQRWMGLGSANTLSLAEAREKATQLRKMRLEQIDPIQARQGAKMEEAVAKAKMMTFDQCALAYMADHSSSWRSAKHARQWRQSLEDHVSPVFGFLPVASIDANLIIQALRPLWNSGKIVTHQRVRQRIEAVLDYARVHKQRPENEANPARWAGHLAVVFDKRNIAHIAPVKHVPALPWREVPNFMAELRAIDGTDARALEWAILTTVRTGSVRLATWDEIDEINRVWTVPKEHTKGNRELRVPLADDTLAVLASLDRDSARVFPISENAIYRVCKRLRPDDVSVHGFRSAFSDWAHEQTEFPRELIEETLAHQVGNQVSRAYKRGDMLPKRRLLLEQWVAFCAGQVAKDNVVPMRAN